ncbi:RNA polymerase subunit sigma, partial [Streptomyces sp. SID5473]|uniref:zf-HC2 domain-containing protein n=1 Tax=Streptomyces sp. SID5473 TaxID=2690299 RepID=UPI00025CE7B0
MTMRGQDSIHDAVGAYVLGVLDDADVSAFEAHLAGCDICAVHVEEFSGLEPMLAALADAPVPPAAASPCSAESGP